MGKAMKGDTIDTLYMRTLQIRGARAKQALQNLS